MYVNIHATCSVFCEPDPESFLFPTGYDVGGALDLTKDSLFNCSPIFFLGGPNGVLHAHNAFSRKTWYKCRVKGFSLGKHLQSLTFVVILRFFYKPITLTALAFGLIVLAYVATTQDVLEEGQDKRRVYVFLSFCLEFQLNHPQWGLCSYCCLSHVLNDPIPRWTIHKTPSCILACCFRG